MKYYVKQKVFSLKDKFTIKDFDQNDVFQVKGKFMSISNKLELLNMDGSQVLNASKKLFKLFTTFLIFNPHGEEVAIVKRVFSLKPKFIVQLDNEIMNVDGSLFGHSFGIIKDGMQIASIQKKVFSFGDSYEIDIEDETKKEILLFIVIIIDQVMHENRGGSTSHAN